MNRVKRKNGPFWPWLAGLAMVCALAGGAALCFMWGALEAYEASTPETAILNCVRMAQAGESPEPPYELLPGRFCKITDYWQAARPLLQALPVQRDELRFLKTGEEERPHYTVAAKEGDRAAFVLYPNEAGGWKAWPLVSALPDYTITAHEGVRLWVNGLALGETEQTGSRVAAGFEALGETAPKELTYRISGLLAPPEITAESDQGVCRLEWPGEYVVRAETSLEGENAAEVSAFLEKTAKLYAAFVSDDADFGQLSPLLIPDTEFYHNLSTFDSHWYVSHDSVAFEDLQVTDLAAVSETAVSGTVSFTYVVKKEGLRPRSYASRYRMFAVKQEGQWKLLELQVQ